MVGFTSNEREVERVVGREDEGGLGGLVPVAPFEVAGASREAEPICIEARLAAVEIVAVGVAVVRGMELEVVVVFDPAPIFAPTLVGSVVEGLVRSIAALLRRGA